MSAVYRRRCLLRASGVGLLGLGLGTRRARACEVQAEFLKVIHPWTRATAEGAEHAVLCMRIDEVTAPDRLIGVSTPLATGAEMGGGDPGRPVDVPLAPGEIVDMHDSGLHLLLTGLRQGLQVGREYPLDLQFERSGTVLARLSVDFPRMRFR